MANPRRDLHAYEVNCNGDRKTTTTTTTKKQNKKTKQKLQSQKIINLRKENHYNDFI